jgi:hypothetical protein
MIALGIVLIILVAALWFFAPVMTAILTVMISPMSDEPPSE